MEHPKSVTADLTANEPPDGTKLIVRDVDEWKVIVRDDQAAKDGGYDDHWFDGHDADNEPMPLRQHLKYADAVYALGEKLAEF